DFRDERLVLAEVELVEGEEVVGAPHVALLQHDDVPAALREDVRGGAAARAAADDDRVGMFEGGHVRALLRAGFGFTLASPRLVSPLIFNGGPAASVAGLRRNSCGGTVQPYHFHITESLLPPQRVSAKQPSMQRVRSSLKKRCWSAAANDVPSIFPAASLSR